MPAALRWLAPRIVLVVGGAALAWLAAAVLDSSSVNAALPPRAQTVFAATRVPTPLLADGPLAQVSSRVPTLGRVVAALPAIPPPAAGGEVTQAIPFPVQPPTLLAVSPALPLPVRPSRLTAVNARRAGAAVMRPGDSPVAQPRASRESATARGVPASRARSVPGAEVAALAPSGVPAPSLPVPMPASGATSGASAPLRDTDLNRAAYPGSLISIRAPPRDVRDLATGITDDPAFAPD